MRRGNRFAWLLAAALCACAGPKKPAEEMPTLKTLAGRTVEVVPDQSVAGSQERTIAAYQEFLKSAPNDPQRPEAMRRLGDLEMDLADVRAAGDKSNTGAPDYKAAVKLYQEYLKNFPKDPGNDRVLYQMARAYEQGGELEPALATLDRLVKEYPRTRYRDEAQFRRGEMLFAMRDYAKAETAYETVLHGDSKTPYYERSLYMQGWSIYKQGRLDEALNSFFGVLDLKLAGRGEESLDKAQGLSRGDRELLDDTFRVTSLSLENLQGADSIAGYMTTPARHQYEFRVYEQLAEVYIKQERFKDAADTFNAFAHRYPLHPQAPLLQARVIEIYQKTGFATLALAAKKDYVDQYGARSKFRQANPAAWEQHVQPIVKTDLAELAQQYHASAQKSKKTEDYQEAVRWYRDYLESFPSDPKAAQTNFLLAELLFEDKRFAEAAPEYEKAAYQYPRHPKSADAGYAALLSYAELEKKMSPGEPLNTMQRTGIDSALRFARTFPDDPRTGAVLANAADKLYTLRDLDRARSVAQQVVDLKPPAAAAQRRVAWTVIAHTAFERGEFDHAEHAYGEVLALTADNDPTRKELTERVAASIYKQAEQARDKGDLRAAVAHFGRVATAAPQSTVRANAEYDAAAALIGLKDWDAAARALESFRQNHPDHPLQSEISGKLAVVYTEQGKWALAAPEFERLAATRKDPQLAREALWQAAELYEKAGARHPAAGAYERYVKQYPEPLEAAVEARYRLARFAKQDGNGARELAWMQEILQADQSGGAARTDRTRYLGATAALALATPVYDEYHKVALVEPLKTQLKLKKARMEEALKAYAVAVDYGVADVATQATYRVAELYHDFGRALLASQRPKGLSKDELEQYDVMLEEQAYPFEEKAIGLHELNARHSADGIYDEWVRKSYVALGELRPVRYAKTERSEVAIDAIR
jgi:TolA-binding protein